ncbi:MAG: hypothetical protein ACTSP4_04400 [Candidatus Hodarchaeales archaeon]
MKYNQYFTTELDSRSPTSKNELKTAQIIKDTVDAGASGFKSEIESFRCINTFSWTLILLYLLQMAALVIFYFNRVGAFIISIIFAFFFFLETAYFLPPISDFFKFRKSINVYGTKEAVKGTNHKDVIIVTNIDTPKEIFYKKHFLIQLFKFGQRTSLFFIFIVPGISFIGLLLDIFYLQGISETVISIAGLILIIPFSSFFTSILVILGIEIYRNRKNGTSCGASNITAMLQVIDAINDVNIKNTNIHYLATGASSVNHTGMQNWLRLYGPTYKDAYFINLSTCDSGKLTLTRKEGLLLPIVNSKKIISIFEKLLSKEEFRDVSLGEYSYLPTGATVLSQKGYHAITLIGLDENGLPACYNIKKTAALEEKNLELAVNLVISFIKYIDSTD